MSSKQLSTLDLPKWIVHKLNESSLYTIKDLISKYPVELMKILNLSLPKVESILKMVYRAPPIDITCVYNMNSDDNDQCVDEFDKVVHDNGLIKTGMLCEICGPPGVGKTQLLFQLCSTKYLDSLKHDNKINHGCSIIYIDTENNFSPARFYQIAQFKFLQKEHKPEHELINMLKYVFVHKICSLNELEKKMDTIETEIIQHRTGMIIIDSLASIVRREFSGTDRAEMHERSIFLSKISSRLKSIAELLNVSILLTNQILTSSTFNPTDKRDSETSGESGLIPAMGASWTHFVNVRIVLQYVDDHNREFLVAKSPLSPFVKYKYSIDSNAGIVFEDETYTCNGMNPSYLKIKSKPYSAY